MSGPLRRRVQSRGALQLDYGELLEAAAADNPERTRWLRSVYGAGSTFAQPEDRLIEVAATAVAAGTAFPRIQLRCGRQDGSAYYNRRVRDQLQALGVPVEYVEEEGAHDRTYCERVLPCMFDFFTRCAKCSAALPSRRRETLMHR